MVQILAQQIQIQMFSPTMVLIMESQIHLEMDSIVVQTAFLKQILEMGIQKEEPQEDLSIDAEHL